ncbi:hypothetical protein D3P09_02495 [Paenibacillus pinisoli]|uniref:Uncharacterized protein n=1 Tax=Paenibacillus pinisoli TaxID=1276110 RepID=A0A3A6PNE9_9BACL|nr:hypothetical protein [Paenibacillus pinisoli]RJX40908.1 hypothetical protein D3P09_02495 [Paenibacillus pinisoli]
MLREQLADEARRAGRNAEHNLKWMEKHPDRFDPSKKLEMQAYLHSMIRFARIEIKNARRAGRTSKLRTRLSSLLLSILTVLCRSRKAETGR